MVGVLVVEDLIVRVLAVGILVARGLCSWILVVVVLVVKVLIAKFLVDRDGIAKVSKFGVLEVEVLLFPPSMIGRQIFVFDHVECFNSRRFIGSKSKQ